MNRSKKIRPVLFIAGFVFGIAILLFYAFIDESNPADKTGRSLPTVSNEPKAHSDTDAEERKSLFMDNTYDQSIASRGIENRIAKDKINQKEKVTADPATEPVELEPRVALETKAAPEPKAAAPAPKTAQATESVAPTIKAAPAPEAGDEVDLLARLITAEAQGEPYEAKVAVGAVVLNRVQSGVWANTIEEVIYQRIDGYYQFTPVQNGWINQPAQSESIKAAQAALSGADPTNGAQFYYDDKATNAWILAKPVSVKIGHMIYAF